MRISCHALLIFFFLLTLPAFGQSNPNDPLDPKYLPSIDENPAHYPSNVWVTSSLAKVQQRAANAPGSVKWALSYAAKNEFESFQVHEQAGGSPITLNGMVISDLVNSRTGTHITASGSPANITVYREAYYNVQKLSDANGVTGYIPDPLIPVVDPYRGQTTNAFPVTIAANQTQSVWFDIFVPPSTPSGYYQGTVTITNGGSAYTTLPVVLAVWNFSLPSTSTLASVYGTGYNVCQGYYGSYTGCGAYPGSKGSPDSGLTLSDIDAAVMLLDHRVSDGSVVNLNPHSPPNNWSAFDSNYSPLLNGTPANTSTILPGAALNEIVYMAMSNNTVNHANLQDWMTHFVAKGWQSKLIAWSIDEPPVCSGWNIANANGPIYHGTNPPFTVMVTSDSADATSCNGQSNADILTSIIQYIDVPGRSNQRSAYDPWMAGKAGRQVWTYQSCMSHGNCSDSGTPGDSTITWPSVMIDASPIRNRIMQWTEYFNNVSGDLYYEVDVCWNSVFCQDGAGNSGTDPWIYMYAFGGNGDGTLIYPGTSAKIGVTNPIPLPSVRLKHIRDGYEDYEYMNALKNNGQSSFVSTQLATVVTNSYTLTTDPTVLLAARSAMGNKLHQLSVSTQPQQPTGLSIQVH